jgi:maleylacetate reductase
VTAPFVHDVPAQRVVCRSGAVSLLGEETERLQLKRLLVVATPGSGARLGAHVRDLLSDRAVGLHARAVMHVPRAIAADAVAAARVTQADGLVAVGGGSAIGLAKRSRSTPGCRSSPCRPPIPAPRQRRSMG